MSWSQFVYGTGELRAFIAVSNSFCISDCDIIRLHHRIYCGKEVCNDLCFMLLPVLNVFWQRSVTNVPTHIHPHPCFRTCPTHTLPTKGKAYAMRIPIFREKRFFFSMRSANSRNQQNGVTLQANPQNFGKG